MPDKVYMPLDMNNDIPHEFYMADPDGPGDFLDKVTSFNHWNGVHLNEMHEIAKQSPFEYERKKGKPYPGILRAISAGGWSGKEVFYRNQERDDQQQG